MIENLQKLEKFINAELSTKVQSSFIENDELLIEINDQDLIDVVRFLKSNFSVIDFIVSVSKVFRRHPRVLNFIATQFRIKL